MFIGKICNIETMKKIWSVVAYPQPKAVQKHESATQSTTHDLTSMAVGNYGYIPELLEMRSENIDLIHKYAASF